MTAVIFPCVRPPKMTFGSLFILLFLTAQSVNAMMHGFCARVILAKAPKDKRPSIHLAFAFDTLITVRELTSRFSLVCQLDYIARTDAALLSDHHATTTPNLNVKEFVFQKCWIQHFLESDLRLL